MPLGSNTQTNIAFKNILGKSETYVPAELASESYGIGFNVPSNNIWLDQLSISATQSILSGYAIAVTASMISITSSNGHAYSAMWPISTPSGIDPVTGLTFSYNTGSLLGINSGNIIKNAISDFYGQSYTINLYGSNGNTILSSDSRNWVYQYNSGIFFQENVVGTNPATASIYVYIGKTLQTQQNTPYTAASFSETKVGGLNNGSSFNGVSITNILNSIFYPTTQANLTNFQIQSVSNNYEVGNGISAGNYIFSWSINGTASLTPDSVYIYGTSSSIIIGPTSNGVPLTYALPNIFSTTPNTNHWAISVKQLNGIQISASFSVRWSYNLFYGSSIQSGLTNSFNSNLQNSSLNNTAYGSFVLPNIGTPSYKYFVIPDSFSAFSSISWNNNPLAMADFTDGYTYSVNNYNYKLVSYTNIYSVTSNYKVFRTKNKLTATLSNVFIS